MSEGTTDLTRTGVIGNSTSEIRFPPGESKPSYYEIPMLKASEWTWMVPVYFAFGGMAGGSFVIARLADRFGGEALRPLARAGAIVCVASLAPCPPLLILDLGDPRRFHHMLRVFKPISPMSVGSWTLTAFSGAVGIMALREIYGTRHRLIRLALLNADAAGIPLALLMTGYTGVLISTTSTPIWAQNPWLGPLFTSSAFETAAFGASLALELMGKSYGRASTALKPVKKASRAAATAMLAGYLSSAGDRARPITHGKYAPNLWAGAVGLGMALPAFLEKLAERPRRGRDSRRSLKIAASLFGIAGGFALKWAIGSAGHVSGRDPEAARRASQRA